MKKFFYSIGLMSLLSGLFVNYTQAGGCYMTRYEAIGTVQTKQAVHIRTMPCMEEGKVAETARQGEVLTVLQESDGWYKVKRSNGTQGRIYYTRLNNTDKVIKKEKSEYIKEKVKEEYQAKKKEYKKIDNKKTEKNKEKMKMIATKIKEMSKNKDNSEEFIDFISESLRIIANKNQKHKKTILMIIDMINE